MNTINQNKPPLLYLHKLNDIRVALENILHDVADCSFEEFSENKMLRQSVMYEMHIVSTSSRFLLHILDDADEDQKNWLESQFGDIPFKALVILREMFFHEGENCRASNAENYRPVWNMYQYDLPAIKSQLDQVYATVSKKYTSLRRKD